MGSDLREGIVTLPVLYYLRAHPDDEKVLAVVRDGRDDGLVHEVVDAIRESGAVDQAMERARDFIVQSKAALAPCPNGDAVHDVRPGGLYRFPDKVSPTKRGGRG